MANGALTVGATIAACYWLFAAVRMLRAMRTVPMLGELKSVEPAHWPKVSLIVPARNEADSIERAVRSRLGDDYPDLETVLVDDRSSDGTGAIVDRLAAADARVVPVHLTQLPSGWLGKVHALHQGVARAHGEWLLFSDADVEFQPGTLRRVIAYCEERGIDHLAALPLFRCNGLLVDAVVD